MGRRKTMDIQVCKDSVNRTLAEKTLSSQREAIIALFTEMLMVHGAYHGFRYLCNTEVPVGDLPGIRVDSNGEPCADYQARFRNTDPTRIAFL